MQGEADIGSVGDSGKEVIESSIVLRHEILVRKVEDELGLVVSKR